MNLTPATIILQCEKYINRVITFQLRILRHLLAHVQAGSRGMNVSVLERERERESHVLSQTATARAHIHRQLQLPTPRPLCPLSLTRQRAISRNPWCSETLKTNASNKHPENLLKSKRKFRFVGTLRVHRGLPWLNSVNSLWWTYSAVQVKEFNFNQWRTIDGKRHSFLWKKT